MAEYSKLRDRSFSILSVDFSDKVLLLNMQAKTLQWASELVDCIHFLHQKGFAPATSSNYSFRNPEDGTIMISASGIDKGTFNTSHLMAINLNGQALNDKRKPSAETLLHTMIYKRLSEANCVLHTHTVFNTVLSAALRQNGYIRLEGYEVLKGLSGIKTHDTFVDIPIFDNSQDMSELAERIENYWDGHQGLHGFLLAGHGLYTWGKDIASAKRQIEVLEFLFECYYRMQIFQT